jgi:hypothetical protein
MESSTQRYAAIAAVLAVVLLLCSCASIQHSRDEGAVRQVANLINAGQAAKLAAMSVTPFLLDGEIVPLAADVSSFWDGIVKAGYRVDAPRLDRGTPATDASYRDFADTMEVKAFFQRYVKGARIQEMTTSSGARVLLLTRSDWFSWKIIGFKGPF